MSRSNYTDTTTSGVTRDRDYDRRDDSARHHGRWTASSEARDLTSERSGSGSGVGLGSMLGRSSSDRIDNDRFDRNRDRDFDRDYDRDFDRNDRFRDRGMSGYNSGYSSSYGSSLGSGFGSSFPQHYGSSFPQHYGSGSSLGSGFGSSYGSVHPMSSFGYGSSSYDSAFPGQHYGSTIPHYGSTQPYPVHYGSMGSGFGSQHYGSSMPLHYGSGMGMMSSGMGSSYGMPHQSYGSRSIGQGGMGGYGSQGRPEVDVYEVGSDYIIEMDLPGHNRDHVETKLLGNELHILSKPPKRDHQFHLNERSLGQRDISRKLYLPPNANSQKINAALTNGVLRITIPKTLEQVAAQQSIQQIPSVLPSTSQPVHPVTKVTTDTTTTTTETKRA